MNQLNLDNLLGEDLFTATQKREIRKSLISYCLSHDEENAEAIKLSVEMKDHRGPVILRLKKNDLKGSVEGAYKYLSFLTVCLQSKKIREEDVSLVIKVLNLNYSAASMYYVTYKKHAYGLRMNLLDKKAQDLYDAFKIANNSCENTFKLGSD